MCAKQELEIAKGIAKAFFVSHYAAEVEALNNKKEAAILFSVGPFNVNAWEKACPRLTNPPPSYVSAAWRLIGRIEEKNETSLDMIFRKAMWADGLHFTPPEGYTTEFGKFLGYNCIGRAVSWFDNHGMFGLLLPTFDLIIDR